MRFQLENLKTARGLNKKAVKSNVPVRPPPSSTSRSPFGAPALGHLGRGRSCRGVCSAPGRGPQRGASPTEQQGKPPSACGSSLHQEKRCQTAAPLPAVLLGSCMKAPSLFHLLGSGFVLLRFLNAGEETNKSWERTDSW